MTSPPSTPHRQRKPTGLHLLASQAAIFHSLVSDGDVETAILALSLAHCLKPLRCSFVNLDNGTKSLSTRAIVRSVGSRSAANARYAEESLKIDERLAALDPTNAIWKRDLAVSRALVAPLRGWAMIPPAADPIASAPLFAPYRSAKSSGRHETRPGRARTGFPIRGGILSSRV